ncbi:MAG: ribonuclease H-like domain-containing protein [Eubacteriales bacterium]|nr:ribonuclease H-like domain-containing protein [Eubacteriales bacterium]
MIVKKMPILQGFPGFDTVKNLSMYIAEFSEFSPAFYDIETTGLSRSTAFVYLIGAVVYEENGWQLYQWLGEGQDEEADLLTAFSDFLQKATCTIQYNGDRFDQPFLQARYALHGIPSPFGELPSLDLYRSLKKCAPLLKLSGMKQPELEAFLGLPGRKYCDGRACIRCCRSYVKSHDSQLLEEVLGHNREDLLGLGNIFSMLSYLALYQGDFDVDKVTADDREVTAELILPFPLPVPVSNGSKHFYLRAEGTKARLLLPMKDGTLRQYYDDYKNYDYLPLEDTVIPKSLSAYVAKKARVPAKKENCYTWFLCTESFLENDCRHTPFLRHTMPYYLDSLNWKEPTRSENAAEKLKNP